MPEFKVLFTNRDEELREWRKLLAASIGDPLPIQLVTGVPGSGKTFLHRYFGELCRTADVPFLSIELDPSRGGEPRIDRAAVAVRLAAELDMAAPRLQLAALVLAMQEARSQVDGAELARELGTEAVGSGVDAFLTALSEQVSISVGGFLMAMIRHGAKKLRQHRDQLQRYLRTDQGRADLDRLNQMEINEIKIGMFDRFARELRSHDPRPGRAAKAVVLVDSLEHAVPADASEHEHRTAHQWIYDLYAACHDAADGSQPRLLFACFGQNQVDLPAPVGHLRRVALSGFLEGDARRYIVEKRQLSEAAVQEILPEAREASVPPRYHVFSLGLLCDMLSVARELPVTESDWKSMEPHAALALRFLKQVEKRGSGDAGRMCRLALTPVWDEDAAAFAFDVAGQPEAAKGLLAWLLQFSFVQPVAGGFTLHSAMRRALTATSEQSDTFRRHREWRDYWSTRSSSSLDAAERRWWLHRYALDPSEAWTAWSEETETARQNLRSADQSALIEVAREWLWDPPLGSPEVAQEDRAVYLCAWADELQQQAMGDPVEYLCEAVAAYRSALELFDTGALRAEWGTAQNNLGNALQAIGRLTGEERYLHESVTAYRSALEVHSRDALPAEWSMTQHNLGNVLVTMGERGGEERFLREAVSALRAALEVHTRENLPTAWAGSQGSLGIALETLGQMTGEERHLHQAVEAYRSALEIYTRDALPAEWARVQNGLGCVLDTLGRQTRQEGYLREAVTAFRSALEVHTREALPRDWAGTLCNLGSTLVALGHMTGQEDLLREAAMAYREALEVYIRELLPVGWAGTQNNLGLALRALGELRAEAALLHDAVVAHHLALEVYTRETLPALWAQVQGNLVLAQASLAEVSRSTVHANDALERALEVLWDFHQSNAEGPATIASDLVRRCVQVCRELGVNLPPEFEGV